MTNDEKWEAVRDATIAARYEQFHDYSRELPTPKQWCDIGYEYGKQRIIDELYNRHPGHKHYVGKTYEMTQENWNKLLAELDEARAKIAELEAKVSCARNRYEGVLADALELEAAAEQVATELEKVLEKRREGKFAGDEYCRILERQIATLRLEAERERK